MTTYNSYAQEKENDTLNIENKTPTYSFGNLTDGVLYLKNPTEKKIEYDPKIGRYIVREKIGNTSFTTPTYLTEEEYKDYKLKKDIQDYFKEKSLAVDGLRDDSDDVQKDLLPTFYVNNSFFNTIFGGSEIKLVPRGSITLRFGLLYQNVENPLLSEENRKSYTPEFDQQIRASFTAKVGERLTADVNYDTQSTFSFQNQVKLAYEPTEDDIIRSIEVGNVNMDVKNNLISGSQSLFGVKTQLQFGATSVTGIFSQQQSQTKNVVAEGGAALSEYELRTTQYDNNKHFFLAQYFRNRYNDALKELPLINSAVQITKVEVWVTNRNTNTQDVRNIVGLVDLGESGVDKYDNTQSNITNTTQVTQSADALLIPRNEENSLSQYVGTQNNQLRTVQQVPGELSGFSQGSEYAIVENARKLTSSEFTYHSQLGYVSLNSRLNDGDVMAVSYEYTYQGKAYRVGELSTDGIESDENIVVKLIRPQLINTEAIVWNLMMKNIYSLGAYDMQRDGFRLDLLYRDDATGQATNNLLQATEEEVKNRTILNLANLDRLDANNNLTREDDYGNDKGDGFFDYVENLTVDSRNGSIIFPSIEPFGRDLEAVLTNDADKDKYVFNELYTTTASVAENDYQNKDKFILSGQFKSSGTDGISLGAFNVPRGSVTVTSGGIALVEGIDYTVDYFAGIVKIINPSIESSGQAVNVSLENNTFFNQQTKTYVGVDVEHQFSDDFVLGATYLNISEDPISNKVQVGQDPINNSMYGLNFNYSTEVPVLTDLANYLPNIDTDAPSNISVRGDVAYLRPNTPRSIDIGGEATSYIDDFEGAQIPINIGTAQSWSLASTPIGFDGMDFGVGFEDQEANYDHIDSGKKRAKLAWYTIDQLFYSNTSLRPSNVDPDELSRAEVRPVQSLELFPERNLDITQRTNLQTFDLTYYPNERGPYNYDNPVNTDKPEQIDSPEERWAGITRGLTTTDFQNSNIQYIEFWIQDPYENYSIANEKDGIVVDSNPTNQKGSLYINLGSISEDVLKDGRKVFENGLPEDGDTAIGIDQTNVANIPTEKSLLYAFDTGDTTRRNQDVGLDGMSDTEEANRFPDLGLADPSSDNYHFYRGTDLDNTNASILRRYKNYNNTEGNSPTAALSQEAYPTSATNNPDVEDADRDQTMNTLDAYWQYKIDLSQNNLSKSTNPHIIDERSTTVTLENGTSQQFKWYQFRVPIAEGTSIGEINSFQSIRFMRMFLTDFEIPVALRFAELQLVRGDWRIYNQIIDENDNLTERELTDSENLVETGTVNIEENENRVPVNYILPPTITRENLQGTSSVLQQNEQSLTVTVKDLEQDNTIGVYKNVNVDMRMFKRLKMFIHAEELTPNTVSDDDLVAVIRLGSDTNDNYYQIEIPLKTTDISGIGALGEYDVWPEANNLDISLADLTTLKLDRDDVGASSLAVYPTTVDNSQVQLRIKGNPNLSNVRTVFMGIKNKAATQKSAEIWFNELRMSGFDNVGGWATNMSADASIADFAKIALNGGYQSIGFGSIDQSVNERSQEEIKNYSVNTSINAGQLLPNDWNVRIPVNYTVSEEIRTPKYDPKYEDVLSKDRENTNSIDVKSKRRSISLINVKKDRTDGSLRKPQVYDIENFSVSYSYSDAVNESYTIEKDISKNVKASANYAFKFQQIEVTPFKNSDLFSNKNLKLIKDFNFNLLPSSIGVNSAIKRNYNEYKTRDLLGTTSTEGSIPIPTLKQRNFLFDWDYNIGYQLTSAINVSFEASNNFIYDTYEHDGTPDEVIDNIDLYSDFFNIGRPSNYAQSLSATYKIPINKIPLLSFVSADYSYSGNFNWEAASPSFVLQVGNTIQNGQTHNFTSSLNFSKLYSEIGLKKLFSPSTKKRRLPTVGKGKKSSSVSVGDFIYGLLSAVKTAKFSHNRNTGSTLNGYVPEVGFLGRNKYNGAYAPSLAYVFGQQTNILQNSVRNNWLVVRDEDDVAYNKNYSQNLVTSTNYDVTIKPINDLNIQFTGTRAFSSSSQQQVDVTTTSGLQESQVNEYGSFNISNSLIKTAINSDADELFNTFINNRGKVVAQNQQYQEELTAGTGTYSQALNSQEVLIQSFVAAYSGNDVATSDKTIFKSIPIPNWQLTYRGLMRLGFVKKNFSNFTLTHGYKSSYTINNFSSNLESETTNPFQSNYIYSGVTLVDAFSPLIKIDVKLKNSLSFIGTINSSRTLSLNLNNTTLSEVLGNEYIFGIGYRIKDVSFKTRFLKKRKTLKGDLNIKADVSYRTDVTSIRSIDSATNQPVGGQNLLGIKVAADYNLSRSFTASLYYDQNVSSYAISTLYPRQSVNAGLSIVYNLGN